MIELTSTSNTDENNMAIKHPDALWAPCCTYPGCTNLVGYHKKWIKADGTKGFKHKSACKDHRTKKKMEFRQWKLAVGCENKDGRYGTPCTTTITMASQIDINHKDGNRKNNDPSNQERLCKCCHSLATMSQKHYLNNYTNAIELDNEIFVIKQ